MNRRDISLFKNKVLNADCKVILPKMPDNSVEAIVTDPPYELGFMNKNWDGSGIAYDLELWKECLRVLKPGGHLLAFGGTRTYHRMVCAIEDAGFEIRDSIVELLSTDIAVVNFLESLNQSQVEAFFKVVEESQFGGILEYVYGSGFPKSVNISKNIDKIQGTEKIVGKGRAGKTALGQSSEWNKTNNPHEFNITEPNSPDAIKWNGYGTALKPAHEPIVVARKPIEGTVANNVLTHGCGGLNIDGCRVEANIDEFGAGGGFKIGSGSKYNQHATSYSMGEGKVKPMHNQGRFPANLIHDGSEEVVREFPDSSITGNRKDKGKFEYANPLPLSGKTNRKETEYTDSGSAARFFYCAKTSKKERNMGCEGLESKQVAYGNQQTAELKKGLPLTPNAGVGESGVIKPQKNHHPTVKPVALIEYLVKLVTKENDIVLDPFFGSGTTGIACVNLDRNFIGIEMEEEYCEIANKRIAYAKNQKEKGGQLQIESS